MNLIYEHIATDFYECKVRCARLRATGVKTLQNKEFKTFINGVGNDLKTGINDLINSIVTIHEDVETLKVVTSKPDKIAAKALLEYIAMNEGQAKTNMGIICKDEFDRYFSWLDFYCEQEGCTQEQALNRVVRGEI